VASVRARVVKTDQSELFHNIAFRNWMILTRLDRVRIIVNNAHIWCIIVNVRTMVLNKKPIRAVLYDYTNKIEIFTQLIFQGARCS